MTKTQPTTFGSRKPSHCQVDEKHTGTNRLCSERAHNLIYLLSQMRAYAHEIAFSWCNPRDKHVEAPLNKNNGAVRTCRKAIWPKGSNESPGSQLFRCLNENKKTLWMKKGKSMDLSIQNL